MNIYPTQLSIVNRLQADFVAAGTLFLSMDMPDSPSDYDNGLRNPISYVVYMGSQADPSSSTNVVAQNRKLKFQVECHARELYGATGLFLVRDIVEQSLIGFKPTNAQRIYLIKDDISQTDEKIWLHVFQFECETMLIQKDETDPIVVPNFQEIVDEE
jgi:hypothetical protein